MILEPCNGVLDISRAFGGGDCAYLLRELLSFYVSSMQINNIFMYWDRGNIRKQTTRRRLT